MFRVKHREYIQDVFSDTTFRILKFPINPGLGTTFNWLSGVAANFEKYTILGLCAVYTSTSADALDSTNTSLGTVIYCFSRDVLDPDFTSKMEMYNYQGCQSQRPSRNFTCCYIPQNLEYYVRTAVPPADADLRLYDATNFFVASAGSQAEVPVGELFFEYDILLHTPKLYDGLGWDSGYFYGRATTGITATNIFGSNFTTFDNYLDGLITSNESAAGPIGATNISFKPQAVGRFVLVQVLVGGSVAVNFAAPGYSGASNVNIFSADTTSELSNTGQTTTIAFRIQAFQLDATSGSGFKILTIGNAANVIPSSATASHLWIFQIPPF